jgi:TRAP-type C4-dicarboxylate transport system substrate-binding protein
MNKNTWNAMPKNIQKAFMASAQEAAMIANKLDRDNEMEYLKDMKKKGVKFYEPTKSEFKKWHKAGLAVQEKHAKKIDPRIIKEMQRLKG